MDSEVLFHVCVRGTAVAAFEAAGTCTRITDVTNALQETEKHLRRIRRAHRALGLHTVAPTPPVLPAPNTSRLTLRSPALEHGERPAAIALPAQDGDGDGSGSSALQPLVAQESFGAPEGLPCGSRSTRTFTPVSTMQKLAHPVVRGLPVAVVAANALAFVAAWRVEDRKFLAQGDIVHECLTARQNVENEEEGCRMRLRQLLLTVSEQMDRFVMIGEYDKFVVFCIEREPVWRQAARQLQKENEARLNSTANIYARFLLGETAVAEKLCMFQVAADYVVSQRFAEREQRHIARVRAQERRRRQSAPQMTPLVSETQAGHPQPQPQPQPQAQHNHHHRGQERTPAPPASSPAPTLARGPQGGSGERRSGAGKEKALPSVEPLSAVEVDHYKEGWRTVLGHLSNGERGRAPSQPTAQPTAAAAKGSDAKRQLTSPPPHPPPPAPATDPRRTPQPLAARTSKEPVAAPPARSGAAGQQPARSSRDAAAAAPSSRPKEDAKASQGRPVAAAPRREESKEDRKRRDREREDRTNRLAHHHHAEAKVR
ncbi:hypothetical protein NESM_000453900 [Novymonas esmeraldas]|uniref:Uncharacterized protein n=1 Tax=Novymonas esmeraldas TaxID=1808958 RepID=A0AAW0EPV7_9TRYP